MAATADQAEYFTRVTQPEEGTWSVEIGASHLPYRYRFEFEERSAGEVGTQDGGSAVQLVCNGLVIDASDSIVRDSLIRGLAEEFHRFETHARSAVLTVRKGGEDIQMRPVRRQRGLTPEFLAEIVRRHEAHRAAGRPPTKTLAAEEGVSVSAVKNWLRHARDNDFVETEEAREQEHHKPTAEEQREHLEATQKPTAKPTTKAVADRRAAKVRADLMEELEESQTALEQAGETARKREEV